MSLRNKQFPLVKTARQVQRSVVFHESMTNNADCKQTPQSHHHLWERRFPAWKTLTVVVAANVSTATCVVVAVVAAATGAVRSHVHRAGAGSHDGTCNTTMPSGNCHHTAVTTLLVITNATWADDSECSMSNHIVVSAAWAGDCQCSMSQPPSKAAFAGIK